MPQLLEASVLAAKEAGWILINTKNNNQNKNMYLTQHRKEGESHQEF